MDFEKLVIFQIDNQKFALPLSVVESAIQIVEIRALPKSPKYICGIINLHGDIVSVINMRSLFGLPEKEVELSDKLIIVSISGLKVALWVNLVNEVIEINERDIVSSDNIEYGGKSVKGIVKLENGMILLNEVEKFLNHEELKELELAIQEISS